MRLSSVYLAVLLLSVSIAYAVSYTTQYQSVAYGESGTTSNVAVNVTDNGWGGILVFYQSGGGFIQATQNCISPGSTGTFYVPVSLSSGSQNINVYLKLYDFWNIVQGNTCTSSSQISSAYSSATYSFTVTTYAGCDYGYPQCDSNHECISNVCQLKKGCQYNNPPCSADYNCQNNQCILKPGCKYANPSCSYGYICEDNACIAIITSQIESDFKTTAAAIQANLTKLDQEATRLIELWTLLNDSQKVVYWTKVQVFARSSTSYLSQATSIIVSGKKKSEVVPSAISYLTSIEQGRATLKGQNPQTIYVDTSQYTVPAPTVPNSQVNTTTTPTTTPTQPTTQKTLDASSVKATIKRIANIDKLADGASLDISIVDGTGEWHSFLLTKEPNDWSSVEQRGTGDISLSILSYSAWSELESSSDVCSELKRQMDRGNIGFFPNLDRNALYYKHYCDIKNCISQEYVSDCP